MWRHHTAAHQRNIGADLTAPGRVDNDVARGIAVLIDGDGTPVGSGAKNARRNDYSLLTGDAG